MEINKLFELYVYLFNAGVAVLSLPFFSVTGHFCILAAIFVNTFTDKNIEVGTIKPVQRGAVKLRQKQI